MKTKVETKREVLSAMATHISLLLLSDDLSDLAKAKEMASLLAKEIE